MVNRRKRRKEIDPAARLALILLRHELGWSEQGQLAKALGVSPSLVSMWERGERRVPREALGRTADLGSFPRQLLLPVLRAIRSFRRAAQGRSRTDRALDVALAIELLPPLLAATDLILAPLRHRRDRQIRTEVQDREQAEELWTRLARCTAAERRLIVEEGEEYQTRALQERVAAESAARVATQPREAQELGELAARIGELAEKGAGSFPSPGERLPFPGERFPSGGERLPSRGK